MRKQEINNYKFWLWFLMILTALLDFSYSNAQFREEIMRSGISFDPKAKLGKLDNGITYYIKRDVSGGPGLDMYLVARAGNDLERQREIGVAHLIEHLAFRSTKKYPSVNEDLQNLGLERGRDFSGMTSYGATVYRMSLPSVNYDKTRFAISVLSEWSHSITIDKRNVEREKGVVLEELRRGYDRSVSVEEIYLPKLLKNDNYPSMQCVMDNISNVRVEQIVRFYKKWYRPDLQCLIVVGDVDVGEIEYLIRESFSCRKPLRMIPDIQKHADRYRANVGGENHVVSFASDKVTATEVLFYVKRPTTVLKTYGDFRSDVVHNLYNIVMDRRMSILCDKASTPFNKAAIHIETEAIRPPARIDALYSFAELNSDSIERGVKMIWKELEKVRRFGFSRREFLEAKEILRNRQEREADRTSQANEYIRHFLIGAAAPGIEVVDSLRDVMLSSICVDDLMTAARSWNLDENRDILILAPSRYSDSLPSKDDVAKWIEDVKKDTILIDTTYVNNVVNFDAVNEFVNKNQPISFEKVVDKKSGIVKVICSNGARILLKPVNSNDGIVRVNGFSPGGSSLYRGDDYFSAFCAATIVGEGGVKGINRRALAKFMNDNKIQVVPFIRDLEEGVRASSSEVNLESMLRIISLYFTGPDVRGEDFHNWRKKQIETIIKKSREIDAILMDSLMRTLEKYTSAMPVMSIEDLGRVDLDRALTLFANQFSNAGDFTFVVTGDFDLDRTIGLMVKYIGSLPDSGRRDAPVFLKSDSLSSVTDQKVYVAGTNRVAMSFAFTGNCDYTYANDFDLKALAGVLEIVLTNRLRDQEGSTYSVVVSSVLGRGVRDYYTMYIFLDCSSDNASRMRQFVIEEVNKLRIDGPDFKIVDRFNIINEERFNRNMNSPFFWTQYILDLARIGDAEDYGMSYSEPYFYNIDSKRFRDLAARFLTDTAFVHLSVLPL